MKLVIVSLALLIAGCTTAQASEECCTPAEPTTGIREVAHNGVLLDPAMRLDIVGGSVETVLTPDGVKSYRLDLTALEARLTKIESVLGVEKEQVVLLNPQGNVMMILGQADGIPAISFHGGPLAGKQTVSLGSGVLAEDTANALATSGLITADP